MGDPRKKEVQEAVKKKKRELGEVPNLYKTREELLMKKYPYPKPRQRGILLSESQGSVFWETMPFGGHSGRCWDFSESLSPVQEKYERGLSAVTVGLFSG